MPRRPAAVHEVVRFNIEHWNIEFLAHRDATKESSERMVVKMRGSLLSQTRWRRAKAVRLTIWADLSAPDGSLPEHAVGAVLGIHGGELTATVFLRPASVSLLLQGVAAGRVSVCTLAVEVGERGKGAITLFVADDGSTEDGDETN